ncbi:uncharacterized protein NPIL_325411 [Nephila pilipes]|uniref:C-factor n=1 Tax=Nephila pilipes TaxID=299642 RepID=A0A8X6MUM6_NEPPI|nr:uncharacterized protein NPIL_325411 [Nephila pilipes]
MAVDSVLVTGANKGIGLEFVRQLVQIPRPPRYVFATYRCDRTIRILRRIQLEAEKIKATEVILIKMDVTDVQSIKQARKTIEKIVGHSGLTLLINNAGIATWLYFPQTIKNNLRLHLKTNTVGAIMVLQEMYPLLQKAAALKRKGLNVYRAAVLNISDVRGSITEMSEHNAQDWRNLIGYRTSKAALNMAMRVYALWMKEQGVLVVNMYPGWVKTEMGSEQAPLKISESVSDMMRTLETLEESHQGAFLDRKGEIIPF